LSNKLHTAEDKPSPSHHPNDSPARNATEKTDIESEKDNLPAPPQRRINLADVVREKQRSQQRESQLRAAINVLSELAHSSTRRLDHTYYSILEKIALLRSTIASLQELTTASSQLHHDFTRQVEGVERDFTAQIEAFAEFGDKDRAVEGLDARIRGAMSRAEGLSERLERARRRVEVWERREREGRIKAEKRLRVFYACLAGFGVVVAVLLGWRWLRMGPVKAAPGSRVSFNLPENASIPKYILEDFERSRRSYDAGEQQERTVTTEEARASDDARLHLLDEL